MRVADFNEQLTDLYHETIGGKRLLAAGHTAVRQVAVIGQVQRRGDSPFLYAVQARLTDNPLPGEALHITPFMVGAEYRQVEWRRERRISRALLSNPYEASRLVLPLQGHAGRLLLNGALIAPVNNMIEGAQPLQALPPTLKDLTSMLSANLPGELPKAA